MASNINTQNINGNYPIAGQDNDSQGFRDNFTNTKNNFTVAKNEIDELQVKAVLLRPLGNAASTSNNFGGTVLIGAQTSGFVETAFLNPAPLSGAVTAAFANGTIQKITTAKPIALTLDWTGMNYPGKTVGATHATMKVWVHFTSITDTLTFEPGTGGAFVNLDKLPGMTGLVMTPLDADSDYLFEFSTVDGVNVLVSLETGPLSDAAASLIQVEADIVTLKGNVAYLEGNAVTQASSLNSLAGDISALNISLDALTPNVVLNNTSNTLSGNIITNVSQLSLVHPVQASGPNVFAINVGAADTHLMNISGDTTLTLAGWSTVADAYSKVRLLINVDLPGRTITFPASVTSGLSNMPEATGQIFTATTAGYHLFELSTLNAGSDVTASLMVEPTNYVHSEVVAVQGNVTTLQSNVTTLQSNVTTLQSNVSTLQGNVTTINSNLSPLLGNVVLKNASNTLNGNVISGATMLKTVALVTAGAVVINVNAADLHVINLTGTINLSFGNWSAVTDAYSRVRILADITNLSYTITFPAEVTVGLSGSNIPGVTGQVFTAPAIGKYMFELGTYDAGVTVMVTQLMKP